MRNINLQKTNFVLKKKKKATQVDVSNHCNNLLNVALIVSSRQTDNGQKMTICSIFEHMPFPLALFLQAPSQVKLVLNRLLRPLIFSFSLFIIHILFPLSLFLPPL